MLSLLGNLFTSECALTSLFLMKQCMTTMLTLPPPPMFKTGRVEQDSGCHMKVFVGKLDRKIIYAECSEDFIDSLLTFLVLPLESASSLSDDNTILGCVKNLCRFGYRRHFLYSCGIPGYYTCSKKLLDIASCPSLAYECLIPHKCYSSSLCKFARRFERSVLGKGDNVVTLHPIDPKNSKSGTSMIVDSGFVKRNTKFIVSDDLLITPMNKFSTIGLLKKMQINMNDFEAQSICIYKAEVCSFYILCCYWFFFIAFMHRLKYCEPAFFFFAAHQYLKSFLNFVLCFDQRPLVFSCKGAKERNLSSVRNRTQSFSLLLKAFNLTVLMLFFSMFHFVLVLFLFKQFSEYWF